MSKRKRSEEVPTGLPEGQEWEGPVTASVEEIAVVPGQPGNAPTTSGNIAEGCEVYQLTRLQPVEVAVVGTPGPPRIHWNVTNQEPAVVVEVDPTNRPELPQQERVSTGWTEEAEADMAGRGTAEPHWFWELLEAVGYDVW